MNDFMSNNEPMNTPTNMFADSVEVLRSLGRKKYKITVKGDSIILHKGDLEYKISAKELDQGRNLTYCFQESHNSATDAAITLYKNALQQSSYSPIVKSYLIKLDYHGVPIDFSVIDAIYKCKPLNHNIELSNDEREQLARGYILGLVHSFVEYHSSQELVPEEDYYKLEIHVNSKKLRAYTLIPPIPNIRVSYDRRSINRIDDFKVWFAYDDIIQNMRDMLNKRILTGINRIAFGLSYIEMAYMLERIKKEKLRLEQRSTTNLKYGGKDEEII